MLCDINIWCGWRWVGDGDKFLEMGVSLFANPKTFHNFGN